MYRIITATSYLLREIGTAAYYDTLYLDYTPYYLEEFNSILPCTEEDRIKHTLCIEVINRTTTVTVGNGNIEGVHIIE